VLDALKSGEETDFPVIGAVTGESHPIGRDTNFDWRLRITYQISGVVPTDVPDF